MKQHNIWKYIESLILYQNKHKKPKLVILSLHFVDCRTQTWWSVDYLLQLFQVCSYSLQHRHRYSLGYLFSIFRKPLLFTIHGRISKWLQQTRVSNNAGPGAGPGRQPHNTPNQINYTQHFTLHYNQTSNWYKYLQSHLIHLIFKSFGKSLKPGRRWAKETKKVSSPALCDQLQLWSVRQLELAAGGGCWMKQYSAWCICCRIKWELDTAWCRWMPGPMLHKNWPRPHPALILIFHPLLIALGTARGRQE